MSMRNINLLVIHCTATKEGMDFDVDDVRSWHKKRGWSDIGYHFLIKLDGTVQEGRSVKKAGAHAKGYNKHSIGISYVGGLDDNMRPKDTRTQEQKKSLQGVIIGLRTKYPDARIVGHRDLPKVKKACPCFDAEIEYGNKKPLPKLIKAVVDPIFETARKLGFI